MENPYAEVVASLQKSYAAVPCSYSLMMWKNIGYCYITTQKLLVQWTHFLSSSLGFTGAVTCKGVCLRVDFIQKITSKISQKFMPAFSRGTHLRV